MSEGNEKTEKIIGHCNAKQPAPGRAGSPSDPLSSHLGSNDLREVSWRVEGLKLKCVCSPYERANHIPSTGTLM